MFSIYLNPGDLPGFSVIIGDHRKDFQLGVMMRVFTGNRTV